MDVILYHNWTPLTSMVVNEPNLLVRSVKRKPTREKVWRKGTTSQAEERGKYKNPLLTITMDADVIAQTGLGSLGVGKAVSAGLANFDDVWREHDPDDGLVVLDDVDDSSEADSDEPLTSTYTFVHRPFAEAA
jgi:hypothetical protein